MNRAMGFVAGVALMLGASNVQAADISAGEAMYAQACAQCHGRTGRGMASFPSVSGQDAEYIEARLIQYREGEQVGPNSALMIPVAADLSDENITDLSAFIAKTFQ
ncbi:MAG: c-type cytochrome [Salinarimonas sp.]|nr:c-type cytochrome [Salinarimonas sp.]